MIDKRQNTFCKRNFNEKYLRYEGVFPLVVVKGFSIL